MSAVTKWRKNSFSSTLSLNKRNNSEKSSFNVSQLSLNPFFKNLDRSPRIGSLTEEVPSEEDRFQSFAIRLLWSLRSKKKDFLIRNELAEAQEKYGNKFVTDLIVYIRDLDQQELLKRNLSGVELCGKIGRFLTEKFKSAPYLPSTPNTDLSRASENDDVFEESAKACKIFKKESVKNSKRTVKPPIKPKRFRLISKVPSSTPVIIEQKNNDLSDYAINRIAEDTYAHYLIQSRYESVQSRLKSAVVRLLWMCTVYRKVQHFLESELGDLLEENGINFIQRLLGMLGQMDCEKLLKSGINLDLCCGIVAIFLSNILSKNLNEDDADQTLNNYLEASEVKYPEEFVIATKSRKRGSEALRVQKLAVTPIKLILSPVNQCENEPPQTPVLVRKEPIKAKRYSFLPPKTIFDEGLQLTV